MKRRSVPILIALLILTLCLGFTACRGDDPTTDTTDGATVAPDISDTPDESGEAPSDEVTEAPTEPETEAPTEPETEAPTEEVTAAPTAAPTEAPTDAPAEETTVETVTDPVKSGCGASVTFGLAALLVAAAAVVTRKKD